MATDYPDYTRKVYDTSSEIGHILMRADSVVHSNGTIGITSTEITWTGTAVAILIENTHATQYLEVSFDGKTNWKTLKAGDTLAIEASISSFDIKGEAAGTTYEILIGVI